MADTTSPIIGMTLMEDDSHSNTWGPIFNSNIELLELAHSGQDDITVTSANVTLTSTQNRTGVIHVTGTLTGNRSIIIANTAKIWIFDVDVDNDTFDLSVKTSSGSAVDLDVGVRVVVCDGSNIVYVI